MRAVCLIALAFLAAGPSVGSAAGDQQWSVRPPVTWSFDVVHGVMQGTPAPSIVVQGRPEPEAVGASSSSTRPPTTAYLRITFTVKLVSVVPAGADWDCTGWRGPELRRGHAGYGRQCRVGHRAVGKLRIGGGPWCPGTRLCASRAFPIRGRFQPRVPVRPWLSVTGSETGAVGIVEEVPADILSWTGRRVRQPDVHKPDGTCPQYVSGSGRTLDDPGQRSHHETDSKRSSLATCGGAIRSLIVRMGHMRRGRLLADRSHGRSWYSEISKSRPGPATENRDRRGAAESCLLSAAGCRLILRMLLNGDVEAGGVAGDGEGAQIGGHAGQRCGDEGDRAVEGGSGVAVAWPAERLGHSGRAAGRAASRHRETGRA